MDYYLMHFFILCMKISHSVCCLNNFYMERCTKLGLCSYVQTLVQYIYIYYNKLLTHRAPVVELPRSGLGFLGSGMMSVV